jgi:hypothetical protein
MEKRKSYKNFKDFLNFINETLSRKLRVTMNVENFILEYLGSMKEKLMNMKLYK